MNPLTGFTLVMLVCLVCGDRLASTWQRKGYSRLLLFVWLVLTTFSTWAAAVILWYAPETSHDSVVRFAAFALSPLAGLALTASIVFVSSRATRQPASRAASDIARYGRPAELVILFLPVALIAASVPDFRVSDDGYLRWAIASFAFILVEVATRITTVYHNARADRRDPVLFLREFRSEPHFLSVILWKPYQFLWRLVNPDVYPFEDLIVGSLRKTTGPVIALGNPVDALPPGDAERVYVSDVQWKEEFARLATKCQAVLLQPGMTAHLEYETGYLLESGLAQKLVLVVPPPNVALPGPGTLVLTGAFALMRRQHQRLFETPPEWTACRMSMEVTGFRFDCIAPGFGSVIGFDREGVATLLADGLVTSDEIARVVQARIEANAIKGHETQSTSARRTLRLPLLRRFRRTGMSGIAAAVLVFAFLGAVATVGFELEALARSLGNSGPTTTSGQWWRLLTAPIVHLNVFHLFANVLLLLISGGLVQRWGRTCFLSVLIGSGLLSGVAVLAAYPFVVVVGADGFVLGLCGAVAGVVIRTTGAIAPWKLSRLALALLAYLLINGPIGPSAVYGLFGFAAGTLFGLTIPAGRASPAPRLTTKRAAVTGIATAAAIAAGAAVVPRVDDATTEFQQFVMLEEAAVKAFNDRFERVKARQMTDGEFAEALETELLPAMAAQQRVFSGLRRVSDDQKPLVDVVLRILELRRRGWEVLLKGLREQNSDLMDQWQDYEREIQAIVLRVKKEAAPAK